MEHIKTLKKLGFTEYEARAYLALSRLGPSTVKDVVEDSKIPRNKAYEALTRLEEKNRIIQLPITPRKYKITHPELFQDQVKELSDSVDSLIKIINQPKVTEFKDMFWIIKTKKAEQEKIAIQNTKVKKELLSCNNLSRILPKNIKTMKEAVDRGVKVKMICSFKKEKIESYKAWLSTGAEIRVFDEKKYGPLLPRISIYDGHTARLTIGTPEVQKDEDYITLWTESVTFSQMLRNHFLNMWKDSKPIEKFL